MNKVKLFKKPSLSLNIPDPQGATIQLVPMSKQYSNRPSKVQVFIVINRNSSHLSNI